MDEQNVKEYTASFEKTRDGDDIRAVAALVFEIVNKVDSHAKMAYLSDSNLLLVCDLLLLVASDKRFTAATCTFWYQNYCQQPTAQHHSVSTLRLPPSLLCSVLALLSTTGIN